MSLAAVVLLVSLAQGPGPGGLSLPSFRLHVLASEELDPDLLRALARPNCVLWLSTRSNSLRESTLENLARFGEAYVELRAPFTDGQARSLGRAPRAGVLVDDSQLGKEGMHRVGARKLAVRIQGALEEEGAVRIRAFRPTALLWRPSQEVDLLSWSRFRQLPGRKWLSLVGGDAGPVELAQACPRAPGPSIPALWLDRDSAPGTVCGPGTRVRVDSRTSDEALRRLYRLDPSVELEVEVGADELAASRARDLLRRLESAAPLMP